MAKRLLLLSNSAVPGETYLEWPAGYIVDFFKSVNNPRILFLPYAGVNLTSAGIPESYDLYEEKVRSTFKSFGLEVCSIHKEPDAVKAVEKAEAIAVGGGNTFYLVYMMHKLGLMDVIRKKVLNGTPYIGWSAGSNVACPTLRTTNDMPIIEPASFDCLNIIPFQINPHYLDAHPEGHGGETRQQRIEEFLTVNREVIVVGLREASLLEIDGDRILLKGRKPMRVFNFGTDPREIATGSDVSYLWETIS
jgi:dipeptidase E